MFTLSSSPSTLTPNPLHPHLSSLRPSNLAQGGATWGTIGEGDIWTDLVFVSDGKVLLATSEGKNSIDQAVYSDPSSSSKNKKSSSSDSSSDSKESKKSSSKKSSSKKSSSKKSSSKKSSSKKSSGK